MEKFAFSKWEVRAAGAGGWTEAEGLNAVSGKLPEPRALSDARCSSLAREGGEAGRDDKEMEGPWHQAGNLGEPGCAPWGRWV